MAYFAVIDSDTVINIIDCESKEVAEEVTQKECVEYTHENPAAINWKYNRESNTFTDPSVLVSAPTE